jgi:hypothetical protein
MCIRDSGARICIGIFNFKNFSKIFQFIFFQFIFLGT